jgi:hypothetical protein
VTIATAIVFCHRFFLRQSHAKNDRRVCSHVFFYSVCVCVCLMDMLYFCPSHSAVCSSCIVVFAALGIFVFVHSPAYVRLLLIIKLFFRHIIFGSTDFGCM